MTLGRGSALDDYGGAPEAIYSVWWPLIPLRRGFPPEKAIPRGRWRQLFLYFDNRFANNLELLFHAANIIMRHAVNNAVGTRVKTNADAFEKFKALIADSGFRQLLLAAKADSKGAAALKVVSRVISFINLIAGGVPWGSRERATEMTKLMAAHRYAGPASIWYSIAPDGVHNETTLRWSAPFTGYTTFPGNVTAEWREALRGQQPSERVVRSADGEILHCLDEATLQSTAARNPVAEAVTFDHLLENVRDNLFRNSAVHLTTKSVASERERGVIGVNITNRDVKECNKRACFHVHGQAQGGATPGLLADIAEDAALRTRLLEALDTQLKATLPLEYHAVQIMQSVLRVGARRDAAFEIPTPESVAGGETNHEQLKLLPGLPRAHTHPAAQGPRRCVCSRARHQSRAARCAAAPTALPAPLPTALPAPLPTALPAALPTAITACR